MADYHRYDNLVTYLVRMTAFTSKYFDQWTDADEVGKYFVNILISVSDADEVGFFVL